MQQNIYSGMGLDTGGRASLGWAGMDDAETVAKCDSAEVADSSLISLDRRAASLANLGPRFQPGQSGNPAGRPTDAERLLRRLLRRHPDTPDKAADALAKVLGDSEHRHWHAALQTFLDRSEGTVATQAHHHVSTDRAIVTHAGPAHPPELPGAGLAETEAPRPE